MERHVALEILKTWPQNESAELTPDQAEALRLLEQDPELDRAFRQLDALDERLSWAMTDVPLDEDARERFLLRLSAARPAAAGASAGRSAVSRRAVLRRALAMVAASTLMLAVAAWLAWNSAGPGLSLATVEQSIPQLWQGEPAEFDNSFDPALPAGGWQSRRVRFEDVVRGVSLTGSDRHEMAVRRFQVAMQGGRRAAGLLLVFEAGAFSSADRPQPGDYVSAGAPAYISVAEGTQLAVVSWTEDDRVYLCVLPTGPSEDALKRALQITLS